MRIYLDEQEDLIDICMDNVFKAVFTKETPESLGALAKLLLVLTGREVESVSIIANEPPIENLRDRQVRFDMQCKSSEGDYFNVEMSMNPDKFEPVRLEYYAGKLFTGQDIRGTGRTYRDLKEAYQIAFLANKRFFEDGEFLHKFEYYDSDRHVFLGGRSRIITIELSKLDTLEGRGALEMSAAERWAYYFRYLRDKGKRDTVNEILNYEEGIAMANKVLIHISRDERERARLMSEYKYLVDTQSKVEEATREGMLEGERKGMLEGERKVAKNMKIAGETVEKIFAFTGLPIEDIAKL